jgi:hypothetical protein
MSNGDKRSVSTDALETLGTIIQPGQGRDAIHLAVEPVQAAIDLYPGQHVGLIDGKAGVVKKPLGIVDPFLNNKVLKGSWFWLVVYPRQITSLRHVWSHPDFPEAEVATISPSSKAASEAWLRDFCANADCPGYDDVMEVITKGRYGSSYIDGEYIHFNGSDAHGEIPPEFWTHVEIVTGKRFFQPPTYFSCSC